MRARYGETTKDVLLLLAGAGVFAVAATSPFFLTNMAKEIIKIKKYKHKYSKLNERALIRSMSGLNKNKIIILKEKERNFTVELTEKGRRVVKNILFENMKIGKQIMWDKKWRIVIFDVPEKRGRIGRDAMRAKLQKLGFFLLQKSVWVCPYPCEKEVQLICEVFQISQFVNIIIAEKLYNDDNLKKYFRLS